MDLSDLAGMGVWGCIGEGSGRSQRSPEKLSGDTGEDAGADSALVRLGAPVCFPLDNPEASEDRHRACK